MVPIAVVGTFWSVARRTILRGGTVALGAVTARNVLWKVLSSAEDRRLEVALIGHPDANATAERGPLRVVDLIDLPVDAILREVATAEEDTQTFVGAVIQLAIEVLKVDLGVVVDDAALVVHDDRKAVGVERASLDRDPQLAPHVAGKKITLRRVVVAVLRLELHRSLRSAGWNDVDHTAHAVIPVEARARTVDDLDAVHALHRHTRPVHPAPERIVERHAVHEDEGAADPARSDPAQRDTLRGWMRRQAAAAPEQAERRHQAQHIVSHHGGGLPDRFLFDNVGADRHLAEALLAPGRRHGHGLEKPRKLEDNVAFTRRHRFGPLGKSAGPDNHRDVAAIHAGQRETPIRAGDGLPFDAVGSQHDDGRTGHGAACLIPDDPGQRWTAPPRQTREPEQTQGPELFA